MSTNFVSDVAQVLSSNLVARISSSLGLDKALAEKALAAGSPGLLAALTALVAKPNGATALSNTISQQPPDLLSSLASMIGSSTQADIIETGASTLTSLLGGTTTSALTTAIAKYAGIGDSGSKSLLGLLGPVVMGVLAKQQRAAGLDARGLANLLTSQKDNIVSALPTGFSKYLGGSGIIDDLVGSSADRGNSAADSTPISALPSYTSFQKPGPFASSGWLIPALAALLIGGLGWHWLSRPSSTESAVNLSPAKIESPLSSGSDAVVQQAPSSSGTSTGVSGLGPMPSSFEALENLGGIKVGDVDVGAQLATAMSGMRSALSSVQDASTAQAALTPLTASTNDFLRLSKLLEQLSPAARKTVVSAILATRPTLDQLFDKALAIRGVSDVIKPTVDGIRSQLDALTSA